MNIFKDDEEVMPENQEEVVDIPAAYKLFLICPLCKKDYEFPKTDQLKANNESIECIMVIFRDILTY